MRSEKRGEKMVSEKNIVINLIMALMLSGVIGSERERHDRPAGLRTHILVGVGATIIMMISLSMHRIHVENDAGRIAAQVVSGVGFLGAGTIIKEGFSVKGLTTAASLWATAAIGLAIGGNYYFLALMTTLLVIITLYLLNRFEFSKDGKKDKLIKCKAKNSDNLLCNINKIIQENSVIIKDIDVERNFDSQQLIVKLNLKYKDNKNIINTADQLMQLDDIMEINIGK